MMGSALTMMFVTVTSNPSSPASWAIWCLLDKPIIAMVESGIKVPDKLVRVADEIVEGGALDDPVFQKRITDAIARVQASLESADGQHQD